MSHFGLIFIYISLIAYLPLIYATIKASSWNKLKDRVFIKAVLKDFFKTIPVCGLVLLPLFIFPKITKGYLYFIQTLFVPLLFLEMGHIYLFGTRIGLNTFYSFFVSNVRETREFISQNISWKLYLGLGIFWIGPYFLIPYFSGFQFQSIWEQVSALIISFVLSFVFIKNWFSKWPKFKDGYVLNPYTNMLYHYCEYKRQYQALQNKIAQHKTPNFDTIHSSLSDTTNQTYIIVIGESANRTHFEWYGYPRSTNEFTKKYSDHIVCYDNVRSVFAQTFPSLERTLSFADAEHLENLYEKGSLIDYFKQAGFNVYWLSNQYALSDTVITAMTTHADWNKCYNYSDMKRFEKSGLDEFMLPDIQKIIQNNVQKKVIFVHLIGSHSAYVNRYPNNFKHFEGHPPCTKATKANEHLVNSYDDSIRYTDWVLSKMIELLKPQSGMNYLLYFSDHGEDVFDSTSTKMLGHSELANEPMTSIPVLLWMSEDFKKQHPKIQTGLNKSSITYTLDDFIHTVLDLSSLSNTDFIPEKSLLHRSNK